MIVMLVHARKGRGTVQGLEEKRAKVPWVLEEVSLYRRPDTVMMILSSAAPRCSSSDTR